MWVRLCFSIHPSVALTERYGVGQGEMPGVRSKKGLRAGGLG